MTLHPVPPRIIILAAAIAISSLIIATILLLTQKSADNSTISETEQGCAIEESDLKVDRDTTDGWYQMTDAEDCFSLQYPSFFSIGR